MAPTQFSIVIPARNEAGSVGPVVQEAHAVLVRRHIAHEIIVVDDGSTDATWEVLQSLAPTLPQLRAVRHAGPHGFGRAVVFGLDHMRGDAVAIMMADGSDNPEDLPRYWDLLAEGHDCAFGSRFVAGGGVVDYPLLKLVLNRLLNNGIRLTFGIPFGDFTNAFKAYRREVIDACRPFASAHFELTVELPLRAILRGCSWAQLPIRWQNRRTGVAKLKLREMGSRYLRTLWRLWRGKGV